MNTKPAVSALALVAVLAISGCQNPYEKFYTSQIPPGSEKHLYPFSGKTQFMSASPSDFRDAAAQLFRKGYMLLGTADFEARKGDYSSQLRAQAKDVGADYVLMTTKFAETVHGAIPVFNF